MERSIFKSMFDRYYTPLCHFARKIVQDKDTAEDVVQDVFIIVWNKNIVPDDERNIKSLLFTMTRNHALEIVRRNGIHDKIINILRKTQSEEIEPVSDEESQRYIQIDQIYVCMRQLPTKCGKIFTMSKLNGLSYAQLAEQEKISLKTVENHMNKAFKILRKLLKNQ